VNGATRRISSSEGSGVGAVGSGTPNPGSGETASLDDYFDRLGAAFARLGDGAGTAAPGPPVLDEVAGGGRVPTIDDLIGGVPARRVSGEPPPSNRVDPRPGEPSGSGPGSTPPAGSAHDGPSGAHVAALLTDEIVDEVTRRVLERLAPDAVRGLVAEIVSDVAERLVREETGRIRSRT